MELSVHNLETLLPDMLNTFGKRANEAFFYISSNCASEKELEIATDRVHPLGRLLYDFNKEAKRSQRSGKFDFTYRSYKLLELYEQILFLNGVQGIERVLSQLDHEDHFSSACFELAIANAYLKSGWDIKAVEEGEGKSPDFIAHRDGNALLIECKSLEDKQVAAERAWNHFARMVNELGERIGWQFGLKIVANDYIDRNQANNLLKFIEQNLRPHQTSTLEYECFQISVQWGPEYETELPTRNLRAAIGNLGRVELSFRVKDGVTWLSRLTAVDIQTHFSTEMSNAAVKLYRKAKKQLTYDSGMINVPAILHIEAPHNTAEGFATIAGSLYETFAKKIQKSESVVDAVVISTFSKKYYTDDAVNLVNYQDHFVVPSFRHKESVTIDEALLLGSGCIDSFGEVLNMMAKSPCEGTIEFEFLLEKALVVEVGSYIFKAVSAMGDYQLRISVLTRAKLRFEVINPTVGRLVSDVNTDDTLIPDSRNKFCFSFTKDVLKVAINGQLLCGEDDY